MVEYQQYMKKLLLAGIFMAFIFNPIRTNALELNPIVIVKRTANTIVLRVSDLVYYLIMQKKYIFNNYTDPNVYPTIEVPIELEKILVQSSNATSANKIISGKPIPVTTSTIPSIKVFSDQSNNSQILNLTNQERSKISLKPLFGNSLLDKIAGLRADDLFNNQYFEHASPDGKSVSDLAKSNNYEYLMIGENLALGNFDGDKGIVDAWMQSPGHKANILNDEYSELGVSVKNGVYKGEYQTIAVQVFGLPLSGCAKPNLENKNLIDNSSVSIKKMQAEAKVLYDNLTSIKNSPNLDLSYYNQKIQEYNYYAKKINEAVLTLKNLIDLYNIQVAKYNACIGSK